MGISRRVDGAALALCWAGGMLLAGVWLRHGFDCQTEDEIAVFP